MSIQQLNQSESINQQTSTPSPNSFSNPSNLNIASLFSDIYAQLEILLCKRLCETKKIPFELPRKSTLSKNMFEKAKSLSTSETEQILKMLHSMVLSHAQVYDFNAVFEVTMQLCTQFSIKKKALAKSSDLDKEASAKEKELDDSPGFFALDLIVETIKTVIDQLSKPNNAAMFGRLCQFLLDRISFGYSSAIRAKASEGLSILSENQLDSVVLLFTKKLSNCKTDDQWREFAIAQKYMVKFILQFFLKSIL